MIKSTKRRRKRKRIIVFICILLAFNIALISFLLSVKPIIVNYAQSVAKRILLNSANESVVKTLEADKITYDDIVILSHDAQGMITGLSIDTVMINIIKSRISLAITELVAGEEIYSVYIPIGTLLGNEFTTGIGPRVKFTMQIATNTVTNFRHEFAEAGLNQVVHRIILDIEINGNLIMKNITERFSVSTSVVFAETVIVGMTPDAFTEVIEAPYNDLADTINDYGSVQ